MRFGGKARYISRICLKIKEFTVIGDCPENCYNIEFCR
jgi:hypothetical protein